MATNNRSLKAYVRFDGSGRAVSSSLIWRKNKPKVGKWKEVQGYECCNPEPGPTFTPIELCYGPDPCVNDCTVSTYYIYQTIIFGIPVVYLLNSENPEGRAATGKYRIESNGKLMSVYLGAIVLVEDCI
jgi:hypothetical protein